MAILIFIKIQETVIILLPSVVRTVGERNNSYRKRCFRSPVLVLTTSTDRIDLSFPATN
ncbi:MAG: hypothetical protein LBC02_10865 [Planctomycetaceae bacterium]|nr:hypothetical protein [Planctomycetaceae bacterium]